MGFSSKYIIFVVKKKHLIKRVQKDLLMMPSVKMMKWNSTDTTDFEHLLNNKKIHVMDKIILYAVLLTATVCAQAQNYTLNGVEYQTETVPVVVSNFRHSPPPLKGRIRPSPSREPHSQNLWMITMPWHYQN